MARVTVAIPFYNNAATLRDAIVSVLNQTYTDWELLLVDDGSRDGSRQIAESFAGPCVRVHSDGRNRGLIARLNEIADLAATDYLARMDGDDVMHPRRLERQMDLLARRSEVDVVDCAMYSLDDLGVVVGRRGHEPRTFSLESLLRGHALNHATVVGRTAWFRQHRYDHGFYRAEDAELWCRTVDVSVFAHLIEPLYFVREGRINVRQYRAAQKTMRKIYRQYGARVRDGAGVRRLTLGSHLKSLTYTIAGAVGAQALLTRRRNAALPAEELAIATRALEDAVR